MASRVHGRLLRVSFKEIKGDWCHMEIVHARWSSFFLLRVSAYREAGAGEKQMKKMNITSISIVCE